MLQDVKILRKLATEYINILNPEVNAKKIELHKAVNDLHMIRPVVMLDELPWHELNFDGSLTCVCQDEYLQEIETFLRRNIYKMKCFPADTVFPEFIPIRKVIDWTENGLNFSEKTLKTDDENNIISHEYVDCISTDEQLEKFHASTISYNKELTLKRLNLVEEILADIIPVKLCGGLSYFNSNIWDDISRYRGVTNILMDLALRPEFMLETIKKFAKVRREEFEQYLNLGLIDVNPFDLHCTCAFTDDLPKCSDSNYSFKNFWGRGTAQIFSSVSNQIHYDYEIVFQKEVLKDFGLVYYGCCEPLDNRMDLVFELPNLRKIGVTPWANTEACCEAIGKNYVVSNKPSPSKVAIANLDEDDLRKELSNILNACKRYDCNIDIVLKDISTCMKNPENIFKWEKIAMELVNNY